MLHTIKKGLAGVAALAALALGGAAIAGAATSSTSSTTSQGASNAQAPPTFSGPAHGTAAHEDAEKTVTGSAVASPGRAVRPAPPTGGGAETSD